MARYGGGWRAVAYSLRKGKQVGFWRLWKAMRSKNACKTCALGMGGQRGGMVNEAGHFPEVCKKSLQAMVADMQGAIQPRFFETYSLNQLTEFSSRELEASGRLAFPVVAKEGDSHYRPISWDEAHRLIAEKMRATPPERAFFYASGRSSNEAGFLLQLLARCYGTNHVSNCSYYCHQASAAGLMDSIGTPTGTVTLEDVENCDLVFLIGGNPASNHPRLMTSLSKLRDRGGKVIVVNPLREAGLVEFRVPSRISSLLFGSVIASHYAQVSIGGDIALMAGIAKSLLVQGAVDGAFIERCTGGFDTLQAFVSGLQWETIEAACGVSRSDIEAVAEAYARCERAIFAWTMGITHHEHGVENVQWIVNLALMRAMVGKPGAGLLPIRGHSNVQGLGSMGVSPYVRKMAIEGLAALGVQAPAWVGHDTMSAMQAASRGELEFGLSLGGNLFGATPDASFASHSLSKLEMAVYLSTSLNTGHVWGRGQATLILPVRARDEESQSTTQESMFNFVRFSDGGPSRHADVRSEVSILARIGEDVCPKNEGLDWAGLDDHRAIRAMIGKLVPNYTSVTELDQAKQEFHIPGRTIHLPNFRTESGRARFVAHPLPTLPTLKPDQLRLMTIRSEGQFNTVVYEDEDAYRGQSRRDVILVHQGDLLRLDLKPDQLVVVANDTGSMIAVVRPFDIAQGCAAMYYPEANALVPTSIDPRSKTPAFKSVMVTISAYDGEVSTLLSIEGQTSRQQLEAC